MRGKSINLKGKVAIVTGGSRGIGGAISKGLASCGAEMVVLDLPARNDDAASTIKEIERDGGSASFQEVDVRDPKSISQAVSAVTDRHGKLDIMVNNAGVTIRRKALELPQEEWDTIQEINLRGVFFGCQAAAKAMIKGGGGKIVNTASELAFVTPRAGINATYIASKLGVVALTRSLSIEWAEHKISVNALAPGPTNTAMMADQLASPDFYQTTIEEIPLGRVLQPEDMVGAVAFLCSDLSEMITGQVIIVDGGRTLT